MPEPTTPEGQPSPPLQPHEDAEALRAIFDGIEESVSVHELGTSRIVDCNAKLCQVFGLTRQEMLGRGMELLFPGGDLSVEKARGLMQGALQGKPPTFEWQVRKKDGSLGWGEVSVRRIEINGVMRLLAVGRDITEKKELQAERERLREQLLQRVRELDATLNASPAGIALFAPDGRIRQVNPTARELMGRIWMDDERPVTERIDKAPVADAAGNPLPAERLPVVRALQGETVIGEQLSVQPPGSSERHFISVSAAPIRDDQGVLTGVVANVTDVTPVHKTREALQGMMSAVTHDLRAPLAAAQGHLQLARRSADPRALGPAAVASLDVVERNLRRIGAMLGELGEAARAGSGAIELRVQDLALGPFIAEVLARGETPPDAGRVRMDVEAGLPNVSADPERLERVLLNLVGNALKHSPAESVVTVRVRAAEGAVTIEVADRGPGIDPADLPRLFERFFRGKQAAGQGLGLGLFIARAFVEAHGGRIWAESAQGQGATFSFTLPVGRQ